MPYSPGSKSAAIALNRFGLGGRTGDLARAAGDPRGWLKAELGVQDITLISLDDPEKDPAKKWKGEVKDALIVVEGGQGLQTGDAVKLDIEVD